MRRVRKWSVRLLLVLLAVILLYVGTLALPSPLFAHAARFGGYRVYSDEPIPADLEQVVEDVAWRIDAMEHASAPSPPRVYLCHNPKLYAFFAFLTRKSEKSLAIGLYVANETFVSVSRVREFAALNRGVLRHTRFEGNLAEVIAHEISHFNSARALGFRAHMRQPIWKSEGWAEYQANVAAIHADPAYSLHERIEMLLEEDRWSGNAVAQDLWEWQILVEFLGEVKGYHLVDLVREDVTSSSAREQMMDWYRLLSSRVAG